MSRTILGTEKPEPQALAQMRERTEEGQSWSAWQCVDMSSADLGRLQFIKIGRGCTFTEVPSRCPDTPTAGFGWRYTYVGNVNLDTGEIA
jgi:hypothetical protein